jgi:hypothetical protein
MGRAAWAMDVCIGHHDSAVRIGLFPYQNGLLVGPFVSESRSEVFSCTALQ